MTLLDATPPKPRRKIGRYILAALAVIIVGGAVYILVRNYPEERAVSRFLTTLEQGNYPEAYRLWQPSATYAYEDFLRNWGEHGDYGKIRTFKILGSQSQGKESLLSRSPSMMKRLRANWWSIAKAKGLPSPHSEMPERPHTVCKLARLPQVESMRAPTRKALG